VEHATRLVFLAGVGVTAVLAIAFYWKSGA
jgi:hypothetical protein